MTAPTTDRPYVMGDTAHERRRLTSQADLLAPFTRQILRRAGVVSGMRVLDIGSGAGDVALLLADVVGPDGHVLGIDRNADIAHAADRRARAAGHANVRIVHGDIDDPALDIGDGFDAAVGRLVFMYSPDVVASLRAAAARVRPGGVLVAQEADFTFFAHSEPVLPLVSQVHDWIAAAFAAGGSDPRLGFRLPAHFLAAGLPRPQLQFDTCLGSGPAFGGYELAAATLRSLLPAMEAAGIATAADVDVDTLGDRLRDACVAADATLTTISTIAAWARVPG